MQTWLKYVLLLAACGLLHGTLTAQNNKTWKYSGFFDSYYYRGPFSITAGGGVSAYRGDLCEDLDCNILKPTFNVGAIYHMWPRVMLGTEINYFQLGANDVHEERNLTFSSTNLEWLLYGRLRIIEDIIRKSEDRNKKPKPVKPYLVTGVGMLFYQSNASFREVPEGTKQLTTDNSYKIASTFPAGLGFTVYINPMFKVSAEAAYRFTLVDDLDDVTAPLGNVGRNDGFVLANLKIQFTPGAPAKHGTSDYVPAPNPNKPSGGSSGSDNASKDKSKSSSEEDKKQQESGSEEQSGEEEKSEEQKKKEQQESYEDILRQSEEEEQEESEDSGGGEEEDSGGEWDDSGW